MLRRALALTLALPLALSLGAPAVVAQDASAPFEIHLVDGSADPVAVGGWTVFTFEVRNADTSERSANVRTNESTGTLSMSTDTFPYFTIPAGDAVRFNVTISVPSDAPPGLYDLRLDAQPSFGATRGASTFAWQLRVEPPPAWRVELVHNGSYRNETNSMEVRVESRETTDVSLALSVVEVNDRLDPTLDTDTLVVPAGGNATTRVTYHLPAEDDGQGYYTLRLTARRIDSGGLAQTTSAFVYPMQHIERPPMTPPVPYESPRPTSQFFDAVPLENEVQGSSGRFPVRFRLEYHGNDGAVLHYVAYVRDAAAPIPARPTEAPLGVGITFPTLGVDVGTLPPGVHRVTLELWPSTAPESRVLRNVDVRVIPIADTGETPRLVVEDAPETIDVPQGGEARVRLNLRYTGPAPAVDVRVESIARGGVELTTDPTTLRARAGEPASIATGGAAVATLGALATIPLWRREWWRYMMAAPLLPLYTRLRKNQVLDHKMRERIHAMIVAEPGINYSAIKEATGLNAGALVHHLRTLERHGLVASRREGILRRFYPLGARLPPPPTVVLTPMQQRILALLDERPMTQRELAQALQLTQQGVSYHVKALERKGQLILERDGAEWRYHRVHELSVEEAVRLR